MSATHDTLVRKRRGPRDVTQAIQKQLRDLDAELARSAALEAQAERILRSLSESLGRRRQLRASLENGRRLLARQQPAAEPALEEAVLRGQAQLVAWTRDGTLLASPALRGGNGG